MLVNIWIHLYTHRLLCSFEYVKHMHGVPIFYYSSSCETHNPPLSNLLHLLLSSYSYHHVWQNTWIVNGFYSNFSSSKTCRTINNEVFSNSELNRSCNLYVLDNQPFTVVENVEFSHFISHLEPDNVLTVGNSSFFPHILPYPSSVKLFSPHIYHLLKTNYLKSVKLTNYFKSLR